MNKGKQRGSAVFGVFGLLFAVPALCATVYFAATGRWDVLGKAWPALAMFGGIGSLFAYVGWVTSRMIATPANEPRLLASRAPIYGANHESPKILWVVTAVWNGIVAIMTVTLRGADAVGILALLCFVTVGLWLLYQVFMASARRSRFGEVVLQVDPQPLVPGGEVAFALTLPVSGQSWIEYRAELACMEYGQTGGQLGTHGSNNYQRTLYSNEAKVSGESVGDQTKLRFGFTLPPDAPATQGYCQPLFWTAETADKVFVRWTLTVSSGDIEGVDFQDSFEIPVVRTMGGVEAIAPPSVSAAVAPPAAPALSSTPVPAAVPVPALEDAANPSKATSFRFQRRTEQTRVVQPAWHKPAQMMDPGKFTLGLVGCLAFIAGGIAFVVFGGFSFASLAGAALFLLAGGGSLVAGFGYYAQTLAADIGWTKLTVDRSAFGYSFFHREVPRDRVAGFEMRIDSSGHRSAQMGPPMYSVVANVKDAEALTLAEFIGERREALGLAAALNSVWGKDSVAAEATPRPTSASDQVAIQGAAWRRKTSWVGYLLVAGFIGDMAWSVVKSERRGVREDLDWNPEGNIKGVEISGAGLRSEMRDGVLVVHIGRVRSNTTLGYLWSDKATPYGNLGVTVSSNRRKIEEVLNPAVSGTFARGADGIDLRDVAFRLPQSTETCRRGGCTVTLSLQLRLPNQPGVPYTMYTHAARLPAP